MEDKILAWIRGQKAGTIAVLRHQVAGIERVPTSDWDVAVKEYEGAKRSLEESLGHPDLRIERRYVAQHFLCGEQIDLFQRFEWNGCCFLETERFWLGVRVGEDGIPRPSLAHDAIVALLVGLLGGGTFSGRYVPLLELALEREGDEFADCLKWAVGEKASQIMMSLLVAKDYQRIPGVAAKMRRALLWRRAIKAPFSAFKAIGLHWGTEIKHHLHPPFPWIAVLGPDGAGKSTVIEGLSEEFTQRRLKIHRVHWRPAFCRKSVGEVGQVNDPHSVPPRGAFTSILKLGYFWCDWAYSHLLPLRHFRAKNKVVIADRFYIDLLIDPRRYRYGGPMWLASLVFRFFPKPSLTIILTGDPETLYARKKEVRPDEVVRQVEAYEQVMKRARLNGMLIDSTQDVESVRDKVLAEVMDVLRN